VKQKKGGKRGNGIGSFCLVLVGGRTFGSKLKRSCRREKRGGGNVSSRHPRLGERKIKGEKKTSQRRIERGQRGRGRNNPI